MAYEIVIGLEVHCQLATESKIFAPEANQFGVAPNHQTSLITLGLPGVLPKLNKKAIELAVKMGLACHSTIQQQTYFDRKNYFYPDLPKGFQTSQDKQPICIGGEVPIWLRRGKEFEKRTVALHHMHLEEDAGKSVHEGDDLYTRLDYNRAGTPLIEMVTEPSIHSAEEAGAFLSEIRKLVRFLGISDGNMEEGSLRADLNISLRPAGSQTLGTKVEIKNMNSIRHLQRAVEFEAQRQAALLDSGQDIVQETRSFDPGSGTTKSMRVKETMNDYRYFPEPDLAPIHIANETLAGWVAEASLRPSDWFERFQMEYGLSAEQAFVLSEEREQVQYFLDLVAKAPYPKTAANWILTTLRGVEGALARIPAHRLAELIELVEDGLISHTVATQQLFPALLNDPTVDPRTLAESSGWLQTSDTDLLQVWISDVLTQQQDKVAAYRKGKKGLLGLFVGEVMKKSKGSADPKRVNELILKSLQ